MVDLLAVPANAIVWFMAAMESAVTSLLGLLEKSWKVVS